MSQEPIDIVEVRTPRAPEPGRLRLINEGGVLKTIDPNGVKNEVFEAPVGGVRYARVNADGSISWLTAAEAVTALTTIVNNANTSITLANSDSGTIIRCTASSAVTITVPSTLSASFSAMVIQAGTGQVTFTAGSGATVNSFGGALKTAGQHASASLLRVGAGIYNLSGNITA